MLRDRDDAPADLAVLDTDLFTCPPEAIRTAGPVLTVVGGEPAWRKEQA